MPVIMMELHLFWELKVSRKREQSPGFFTGLRAEGGAIEESCKAKSVQTQHPSGMEGVHLVLNVKQMSSCPRENMEHSSIFRITESKKCLK